MSKRKNIIVKVGTGVLTKDDGHLDLAVFSALSRHLSELKQAGHQLILVSSGAVGAGVPRLGLSSYPEDVETRQAAAAIGQAHLMQTYQEAFQEHDIKVAQILLSSYDLREEKHRKRVKQVLLRLLENEDVLPIINENDVVSLRELTKTDNDMLAANLSGILNTNLLILLTSVDGVLNKNDAVIPEVSSIDEIRKEVTQDSGKFSIGGMNSKLDAVEVALSHGTQVVIGNGAHPERLKGYSGKTSLGTYFS